MPLTPEGYSDISTPEGAKKQIDNILKARIIDETVISKKNDDPSGVLRISIGEGAGVRYITYRGNIEYVKNCLKSIINTLNKYKE